MAENIEAKLRQAMATKAAINAGLDQLSAQFEAIEVRLAYLNLQTTGRVRIDDEHTLAYKHSEKGWNLVIEAGGTNTQIRSASKSVRILAAHVLSKLIDDILSHLEVDHASVSEALSAAQLVCEWLTPKESHD